MKAGLWCGLLLMSCLTFNAVAQEQPAPVEHLVFVSSPDGNDDILITDTVNGSLYNLTANPARDWHPDWSPDGTQIVFTSDRDGSADIFIMNSNGTAVHNVTNSPDLNESAPSWSPDGKRVVYLVQHDKTYDLYTQPLDPPGKPEPLTSDGIEKGAPAWSPDSSQVAFWRKSDTGVDIVAVDQQSGNEVTLVREGINNWPAFSPDGTQLAFYRVEGKLARLYTLDLTDNILALQSEALPGVSDLQPTWSPRGTQLAFSSDRTGSFQIFVEVAFGVGSPLGTFARAITHLKTPAHSPAWEPLASAIDFPASMHALSQSVQVVENASGQPNAELGAGLLDISAPEQVTSDDVIDVRLELHPPKVQNASAPMPTSTVPSLSLPGSDSIPLRASKSLDIYQLMGAELSGFDLEEKFDIYPLPTNYVIAVQPDDENYWEWWLQPKGPQSIGKHTFFALLYLPEQDKDGRQITTTVVRQQFTVQVTRGAMNSAAQAAPPTSTAPPRLRVQFDSDHFSMIVLQPLNLNGFSISSSLKAIQLDTVFTGFAAVENIVPANVCLHFIVYQTQPPLPIECHGKDNFTYDIGRSDVFWYDGTFHEYVPTVMRTPEMMLGTCPGDAATSCDIYEDAITP